MKVRWMMPVLVLLTLLQSCRRQEPDLSQVPSFPVTVGLATDYKPPRAVDIQPLVRFFSGATWVDGTPSWKMPYTVSLRDGRELTVDELTCVFAIKGVPGYFRILPPEEKAFTEAITAVLVGRDGKQPSQPPVPTRGNGT